MNTRRFVVVFILVALIGVVLWRASQKNALTPEDHPISQAAPQASSGRATPAPPFDAIHQRAIHTDVGDQATNESYRKALIQNYVAQMQNDPLYEFKIPMRFYGVVLDEFEKPVASAGVHFEWNYLNATNDLERKILDAESDGQGMFSLDGQTGKRLNVTVAKAGYYSSKQNPLAFEFADPASGAYYSPDSQKPVVFHLRKKGLGAALITSNNGMRPGVMVSIPMDGIPITLDLLHQKAGESGPLQVSQGKPSNIPWQQATQWSFRMTIPDGGLIENHDEYPFEAPEQGYQSTIQLDFQKDNTNWTTGFKKSYYFRFGSPPSYGILRVETSITDPTAQFTYAINPDGSRNLEPQ